MVTAFPDHRPQLVELRRQFIARAFSDADALERAVRDFQGEAGPAAEVASLRRSLHRLVGGLGTFGFLEASHEAEAVSAAVARGERDDVCRKGQALVDTLRALSV